MAFETTILIDIDSRPAQKGAREFRSATDSISRDVDRTTAAIDKSLGAFGRMGRVLSNLGSGDIGLISLSRQIATFDQGLGRLQQRLSRFGRAGALGFGAAAVGWAQQRRWVSRTSFGGDFFLASALHTLTFAFCTPLVLRMSQ